MADAPNFTVEQLRIMRHMLGIETPDDARPKPYRNYYCSPPDDPKLVELAKLGAIELYSTRESYHWYRCTPTGHAAAMASHRTIRRTKSQRVYARFLDVREPFPDLTFKDFLTHPDFAETRRSA